MAPRLGNGLVRYTRAGVQVDSLVLTPAGCRQRAPRVPKGQVEVAEHQPTIRLSSLVARTRNPNEMSPDGSRPPGVHPGGGAWAASRRGPLPLPGHGAPWPDTQLAHVMVTAVDEAQVGNRPGLAGREKIGNCIRWEILTLPSAHLGGSSAGPANRQRTADVCRDARDLRGPALGAASTATVRLLGLAVDELELSRSVYLTADRRRRPRRLALRRPGARTTRGATGWRPATRISTDDCRPPIASASRGRWRPSGTASRCRCSPAAGDVENGPHQARADSFPPHHQDPTVVDRRHHRGVTSGWPSTTSPAGSAAARSASCRGARRFAAWVNAAPAPTQSCAHRPPGPWRALRRPLDAARRASAVADSPGHLRLAPNLAPPGQRSVAQGAAADGRSPSCTSGRRRGNRVEECGRSTRPSSARTARARCASTTPLRVYPVIDVVGRASPHHRQGLVAQHPLRAHLAGA